MAPAPASVPRMGLRVRAVLGILVVAGLGSVGDLLRRHRTARLARRTRRTLERLGPTFIKLGQVLSKIGRAHV